MRTRTTERSWMDRLLGPGIVAATVLVVATPLAAAVRAIPGWMPVGDIGLVTARSIDTFSRRIPLVGVLSSISADAGQPVYHLGPLQFWLVGVFAWLGRPSPSGVLIGSAVIASVSFACVLFVAQRRRGLVGLAVATVLLAALMAGLGPGPLRTPFNPYAAMLSGFGFLASAWATIDRDRRWLPVTVVFASLCVQSHFSFVIPVLSVIVMLLVILGRDTIRARRDPSDRPSGRSITILSALAVAACWSGPIIDQFWGTGNLAAVFRAGTGGEHPVGIGLGLSRLVGQLQVPPLWLLSPDSFSTTGRSVSLSGVVRAPSPLAIVTAVAVTIALLLSLRAALGRRDRTMASLGVIAVVSLLGATAATSLLPDDVITKISTTNEVMWWPAGMFTWMFLVFSIGDALLVRAPAAVAGQTKLQAVGSLTRRRGPAALGVAATIVLAASVLASVTVRSDPRKDFGSVTFGAIDAFSEPVLAMCRRDHGRITIRGRGRIEIVIMPGVIARARLAGCDVQTTDPAPLGRSYAIKRHRAPNFVLVIDPPDKPDRSLIATYDIDRPPSRWKGFDTPPLFFDARRYYLFLIEP